MLRFGSCFSAYVSFSKVKKHEPDENRKNKPTRKQICYNLWHMQAACYFSRWSIKDWRHAIGIKALQEKTEKENNLKQTLHGFYFFSLSLPPGFFLIKWLEMTTVHKSYGPLLVCFLSYFCNSIVLGHHSHSLYAKEQHEHFAKRLVLCSTEERTAELFL